MKISLSDAKLISLKVLKKLGFRDVECNAVTNNIIASELANKPAHGLNKLIVISNVLQKKFDKNEKYFDYIDLDPQKEFQTIKESPSSIYINGNFKTGYYVEEEACNYAITKAKDSAIYITSLQNLGFATGFIGYYARKCTNKGYVYIGFHNSSGGLVPTGSIEDPWGTNPITIGFPSTDNPVIVDTSLSQITWNEIEQAKVENRPLPRGSAIDEDGNLITDAKKAFAVNPIGGHKGSALAMGVELLAGALSGSRIGFSKHGGWGSTFILINPEFFVGVEDLKEYVAKEQNILHSLKTTKNEKVYFPGQKSSEYSKSVQERGYLEISNEIYQRIINLV